MAAIFLFFANLQALFFLTTSSSPSIVNRKLCVDIDQPPNSNIFIGNHNSYYKVTCDPGYTLLGNHEVRCVNREWDSLPPQCVKNEANVCEEPEVPENGGKTCQSGPFFPGKSCNFHCFDGYRLSGINRRVCMSSSKWSGKTPKCIPVQDVYCPAPPPLDNGKIVSCSSTQKPKVGKTCHFRCNEGYILQGSDHVICKPNGQLTDENDVNTFPKCVAAHPDGSRPPLDDPCKLNNGCQQVCKVQNGEAKCRCWQGYILAPNGKSCTVSHKGNRTTLPPNPCRYRNGGCEHKCIVERNKKRCVCNKGYIINDDRRTCKVNPNRPDFLNPCLSNNGECQQVCTFKNNQKKCECREGYMLDSDQKSCTDVDECLVEDLNKCNQVCHNKPGGYTCSCHTGYIQVDEYKCEGCRKHSYWSYEEETCVDCPRNSFTDSEAKTSINDCFCLPGYTGDPSQDIPCEDIDECAYHNFGCSSKCVNTPGGAYCSCPFGYKVDSDNKTCIDIDECSIKKGGCQGNCHNTEGSFYCSCLDGYVTSNKDSYSCDDIDECLENNGGCEQKCINYPGGYYCACENGFRLDSGMKNCSDIQCSRLPVPSHSTMMCKKDGENLHYSDRYPVGTACFFSCFEGFKIATSSNTVECLGDGTWDVGLPECKSQQCDPLEVPENGEVHPPSCSEHGNSVKQICTFTCHSGYKLKGKASFKCRTNLTWTVKDIPVCEIEKIHPTMKCSEDISVDLLPGKETHSVIIPEPVTNMKNIKVKPKWVSVGVPVEFPAGETIVALTATDPNAKRSAQCSISVNVLDKELPVFEDCPDDIQKETASADGIVVSWKEPTVVDNVRVSSLESPLKSNTIFRPGTYTVEYIAKDDAGNAATCSFHITISRFNCEDLPNPGNGEANCMEWTFGKLCRPSCDDGYMRDPHDPQFYSCSESGTWEPNDEITDCLRYIPALSSECPENYELQKSSETGEEICMECPPNAAWSPSTKTCDRVR